ncbi:MAG: hypothetical protein JO334_05800 [Verrucomicrobia bacterium]|nr:hypothetical protein [Verrucomicrobiota bacterium]
MQAKKARTPDDTMTGTTATVRFQKIVESTGKPSVHLLWIDPAKDPILQKAVKANCVMTVHQRPSGTKTDFGTIGFEKNVAGQILIFPKSLKSFAGKRVVGVKYDSIEWPAVPKNQQTPKTRPLTHSPKTRPEGPKTAAAKPAAEENAPARVVKFPTPRAEDESGPEEDIEEIKEQVRHAMKVLEEGKQVAAFNLLKRIVE